MKKRLCILLIAALLLLLTPHFASANSPIPWAIRVECENVEQGTRIDFVFLKEDGSARTQSEEDPNGVLYLDFSSDETSFYLVCTAPDGTETRTESVKLQTYGQYKYNGATNRLTENGVYYNGAQSCAKGAFAGILYLVLLLILPLGLTLLFEFLVAVFFRIRPKRYVLIANLITNPAMNLLLVILMLYFGLDRTGYWIALGVLELAAVWIEYAFYRKKYLKAPHAAAIEPAPITGARLLVFSVVANAASFAVGAALGFLL